MKFSYKKSGVDYDVLDTVKRLAQTAAMSTKINLDEKEFADVDASRGESAYVIEADDCYFAFVTEGLGTKNLVADEMRKITGKTYYEAIAYDTVAAIINDLITVGAKPLSVLAYWAVGDSQWFTDRKRAKNLIAGWTKACDAAGAVWGGGETPTLNGIINTGTIDLGGSAFGVIKPKNRLVLGDKLTAGDVIILFESSGIHANGLSLARKTAATLPKGYATKVSDGNMYGEELLKPTAIYSKLIRDLIESGVDIHYMVNITGHGWRKLMRVNKELSYVIDKLPKSPPVFKFIKETGSISDREMYATFNMGAGYAIFVEPSETTRVLNIAKKHKINSWPAGKVQTGEKKVIIKPLNIVYKSSDLSIR